MTQTVPCDRWEHAAGTVDQEILGPPTHEPDRGGQCRCAQNVVLEQVDLMIAAPPQAVSFTCGGRYLSKPRLSLLQIGT